MTALDVCKTGTDLHVPEELGDLHGPEDDVLDSLLANATQRSHIDVPWCLGLLLLWRQGLPAKG